MTDGAWVGKRRGIPITLAFLLTLIIWLPAACLSPPPATSQPTYSLSELKYLLYDRFGEVFFCDPDYYPVAREGQEESNAVEQFPALVANTEEFSAILKHIGLSDKPDYNIGEKVLIYREHKKLAGGVQTTASPNGYSFSLRIGEGQGSRIEGVITTSGQITIFVNEPNINTCPICLSKGTLIDTPSGPVSVEQLSPGMRVWSLDELGQRGSTPIVAVSLTPIPTRINLRRLSLSDGRSITASPGHPTGDGRVLGKLVIGDVLDGAVVVSIDSEEYNEGATYDLLPGGASGLYWANGILLGSSLRAGPVAIYR